jgi:hypothetical protein
MGRIKENSISGLVGTVVLYSINGKNYVRSRPRSRKKKRGAHIRPENTVFGTVSTYGTRMIKCMARSFLFPFKLATYNGVRGWMRNQYAVHKDDANWELSAKRNTICQLNPETDLRDFIDLDITVSDNGNGKISVTIPSINPAQDIKAPLRTQKINIRAIATTSLFRDGLNPVNFCMDQYSFNYSNASIPSKTILLDTRAAAGDIAIVVVALEFETADTGTGVYNKDIRWLPAAVIAMGRMI